jgi:type IV pilus assembly protein PilC
MAIAAAQKVKPKAGKAYEFTWEGIDRRGNRVKGELRASSIALARADLRRQGVNPKKVRKKSQPLFGGGKKKRSHRSISRFSPASWQP